MIFVVYAITIVLFVIAAMILPLFFAPFGRIFSGGRPLTADSTFFIASSTLSTVLIGVGTAKAWSSMGYTSGWLLVAILIGIHVVLLRDPGANPANVTLTKGTILGLIIFGIAGMFIKF
ncbi:MAG: hypothetical protein H0X02_11905 [Nitrosomonas sp.]|nr:hypothetical protein [Nitrosomonas sp.]